MPGRTFQSPQQDRLPLPGHRGDAIHDADGARGLDERPEDVVGVGDGFGTVGMWTGFGLREEVCQDVGATAVVDVEGDLASGGVIDRYRRLGFITKQSSMTEEMPTTFIYLLSYEYWHWLEFGM